MQYRRGEYILNRLQAQIAVNKVVSLTYRGVDYEKQLYIGCFCRHRRGDGAGRQSDRHKKAGSSHPAHAQMNLFVG